MRVISVFSNDYPFYSYLIARLKNASITEMVIRFRLDGLDVDVLCPSYN